MASNLEEAWTVPSYSATALRLMHNNTEPTSSDVELILEDIARGKQSLAVVDAEISSVEDSMDQLLKKYNEEMAVYRQDLAELKSRKLQIIDYVDANRQLISPYRTNLLPPEIMAEIFTFSAGLNVTDNPKNGIWRLGRVCSSWRRTLLSHPRLWSRIYIVYSSKGSLPAIIAELLSRSKDVPLDIVLSLPYISLLPYSGNDLPSLQNDPAILPLLAVSRRWRSLTVHGGRVGFLASIRGNVPLLQQISFMSSELPATFDCMEVAPSLTDVRVYGSSITFPSLRLPWSQLRFCALPCLGPNVQLEILRRCPNLQTFSLGPHEQRQQTASNDIITVGLRRLTLAKPNSSYLLPNLLLPSLEYLSINAALADNDVNGRVTSLINRSDCPLSTLEVGIKPILWDKLASFLSNVPFHNLKTLDINGNVHCKSVADVLTLRAGNPIILPQLTRFLIRGGMDPTESSELFTSVVEMARSRRDIIPELHESVATLSLLVFHVYLSTNGYPEHLAGILNPLKGLHAQGLVVEVDPFFLEAIPSNATQDHHQTFMH